MNKLLLLSATLVFASANILPVLAGGDKDKGYDSVDASDLGVVEIGTTTPVTTEIIDESLTETNSNSFVETAPEILQTSSQNNLQINHAFGVEEWPMSTMSNVGALPNGFIGFSGGYVNSSYGAKAGGLNSNSHSSGYDFRVFGVLPMGTPLDEKIERLGEEEIAKRRLETLKLNQEALLKEGEVVAQRIANWNSTIQMCVNLDRNNGNERIVINRDIASPVFQNILAVCEGLDVVAMQRNIAEMQQYQQKLRLMRFCQENPDDPKCKVETPN